MLNLLQEFDITINDSLGKENPVANFLSRMPKLVDAVGVEDIRTPWYSDVANYLVVGKLHKNLTSNERKQIGYCSTRFSLDRRLLIPHRGRYSH